MMNTQNTVKYLAATLCGLGLASVISAQSVIYFHSISASEQLPLSDIGWSALGIADADQATVDASNTAGQFGVNTTTGFFAPHFASGTPNLLNGSSGLVYTDNASLQVDIGLLTNVGYDYIGDPVDATYRVAVQVGGQWYAQAPGVVDTRDDPGAGGVFLSGSYSPADFTTASNWLTIVNAEVGTATMGLGAAPSSDLAGTIQAMGLYLENGTDHIRFRNYEVTAIPEAATAALAFSLVTMIVVVGSRRVRKQ